MDDRRHDTETRNRDTDLGQKHSATYFVIAGVYEVLKWQIFDMATVRRIWKHTLAKTPSDPAIFHDRAYERTRRSRD